MRVLLLSTYELGRQPFGLASPAGWLRRSRTEVRVQDLAREPLNTDSVSSADVIALYLPMHTATRVTMRLLPKLKQLNPGAHFCCYGLYAPLNEDLLRAAGVQTILGGEFESGLVTLVEWLENPAATHPVDSVSLPKQRFVVPDRRALPPLSDYSHLNIVTGGPKIVGYTEASRGCLHLCRHCPIVPVYQGALRIVQKDVVLADISQQVEAGAQHMTFGDPDFFNGPGHSLAIVQEMHRRYPQLTFDVTIKIEHLLKYRRHLDTLRASGCLLVTSAVESIDDHVLRRLAKGHTRRDFIEALELLNAAGLAFNATFVPFTPWTTWEGYRDLLRLLMDLHLVENVAPIQLGIRLLVTAGSRLLDLPEIRRRIGTFDSQALVYPWRHPDPSIDALCRQVLAVVEQAGGADRVRTFLKIWELAFDGQPPPEFDSIPCRCTIPYLNEPWYC